MPEAPDCHFGFDPVGATALGHSSPGRSARNIAGPGRRDVRYVTMPVRRARDRRRAGVPQPARSLTTPERQIAPMDQSAKVMAMAETPFTNVTPPNEISADRSGMRVSVVQTQK